MKKAYFVVGPECSGAMVVTNAICSTGVFGDASHFQRLDDFDFNNRPEKIVLRRTCPHGDTWPDLIATARMMMDASYMVVPILVIRNTIPNIESQVLRGHSLTHRIAHDTINYALERIHLDFAELCLMPMIIHFESFVKYPLIRETLFNHLGLEAPSITFHDSSCKYRTAQDPIVINHKT